MKELTKKKGIYGNNFVFTGILCLLILLLVNCSTIVLLVDSNQNLKHSTQNLKHIH